jgi:hypothetical protein
MDSSSATMDALLNQFERLQRPIDLVQTLNEKQVEEVPARCWDLVTTNYQEQIWILLFCVGYNQIDQVRIWIGIAFINQFLV